MTLPKQIVFLVDVDDTLLENDRIQDDLKRHIEREFGTECRDRFWAIQEELFQEWGYRDYLGALQRFRMEHPYQRHLVTCSNMTCPACSRARDAVNYRGGAMKVLVTDIGGTDVKVELLASRHPSVEEVDAYERVLGDAMEGDATLFAREDYVEEAWRIVDGVLKAGTPLYGYEPGTLGPSEVDQHVVPPGGWQNPAATE